MKANKTNHSLSPFFAMGLGTLLASSLMGSCTSSEDMPLHTSTQEVATSVNLSLGVSGGMTTRELDTWDAAQQVNDMRIYLFRCAQDQVGTSEEAYTYYVPNDLTDTGKGYYSVSAFDNQTPYYSAEHNYQPEQHTYSFHPLLETGYSYKFLAVGRDDKNESDANKALTEPTFTTETTTLEDASIALTSQSQENAQNGNALKCTELFSGTVTDETTQSDKALSVTPYNKSFEASITLTRNVAGLILYVQNIPSVVEDNTTTDSNPVTFTPTSLTLEATSVATATLLKSKSITNDNTPLTYQTLAAIDLTTDNGWTNDTSEKIFKRSADTDKGWKENSYLASNFMMPTPEAQMGKSKNAGQEETTFYLHYTDGTHHRYDNVKLVTGDTEKLKFPIEANHLYCIGAKSSTTNDPYDLKKHYEPVMVDLTIEIEPAFEKKHEFETE